MDTVLFVLHIRGLKPLLVFYFRVEEIFAGGKFREIPFGVDIIFAGGKFRAKSKFANIAKISSTRKIGVRPIQYSILTKSLYKVTIMKKFRGPLFWSLTKHKGHLLHNKHIFSYYMLNIDAWRGRKMRKARMRKPH